MENGLELGKHGVRKIGNEGTEILYVKNDGFNQESTREVIRKYSDNRYILREQLFVYLS